MSELSPVEQDRLNELGFTWAQLQEAQNMSHVQMGHHLQTMAKAATGFDRAALIEARVRMQRMATIENLVKAQ